MNILELFARIGVKADEGKLKSFQNAAKGAKVGLIALTAGAAATSAAIVKITSDATKAAVALKQFEAETGSSAQELQKWQSVAEQTNQSAQSVTSAVEAIVANQEKIKLGQGNISGFQLLGIDPRDDPFEILEQLREKTDGLTEGMTKNVLQQLGVGTGLIQTLKLSREEFDAMAGKAFIISPGAIESLNKLKASMDQAGRAFAWIKAQIAVGLAPQITALTEKFRELVKTNEEGIVKGFQEAFGILKMLISGVIRVADVINSLVRATIGWKTAIKGVAIAMAAMNATFLMSPIGLFTAAVILLVAILDDLAVYSRGGQSMFGKMVEKVPALGEAFEAAFGFMKDVIELIKAFASGDEMSIKGILEEWGTFGDIIQGVYDGLVKIRDFLQGEDFLDWAFGAPDEAGQRTQTTGFNRMFGTAGAKSTTNNNNTTININGSESPEATGREVQNVLQRIFSGTSAQRGRNE